MGVMDKIDHASAVQRKMFKHALSVGRKHNIEYLSLGKKPPLTLHMEYEMLNRTVFSLVRKELGLENAHFFPTAGAAVSPYVEEFVHSIGINMIVGYGLTESLATVSCDHLGDPYTVGSVGIPIEGISIKVSEEGEILLNGINIQKYDYEEYMSLFSVVFQDYQLFSFTLGENVASQMHYDKEKAERCLDQAGFSDRLHELPNGLDTYLNQDFDQSGVELSGGEAQKVALARALYKDAPFVVLDEPTAALDPLAEYEIYTRFNDMVGSKTAVYISHRLSSCRFCDEIAVFQDGALVQYGEHSKLLADEDGPYYALWNAQAQYYIARK